ncbi:MAG: hypothetical protein ABTQ25_05335 [Nitrosomonas ureae]
MHQLLVLWQPEASLVHYGLISGNDSGQVSTGTALFTVDFRTLNNR